MTAHLRLRRIGRWAGLVLLGVVGLIMILAAGGAAYETIMAAGDDERYPARGQLVDVGGSRLHIYCVGEGSPTVVLDAGLGGFRWIGRRLIGSRHEYVDANRSAEVLAAEHKQQLRFQRVIWITARIGLVRAFWAALWPKFWPTTQNLTPETRAEIGVLQARPQQIRTVLREDALLKHDNAQLSAAASLGSRPLIVLAAGETVKNDPVWLPAQQQLARLSSNVKLIVVDGSSHYIHWDRPTLVADAISQVVEDARNDHS